MINIGQIKYPKYTIDRQTEVFQTREEMMRFCSAVQLEADIREAMEANNIDWALSLFEQAKQPAWDIITNAQQTEYVNWSESTQPRMGLHNFIILHLFYIAEEMHSTTKKDKIEMTEMRKNYCHSCNDN